jgi:uncharacterized membrane protein YbhN (UPF0104 family)
MAVALERFAYLLGTTVIVGFGALLAAVGLPLTQPWARVFWAFAIGAAAVTAPAIFVACGRGTYFQALLRRMDHALGTSAHDSWVGRFIAAAERQMVDLVRGNRTRLLVLLTATAASYGFVSLEVWVILRAVGAPISLHSALGIETFSRVASFASAFIPANLGALEASSFAAATAVGAVGWRRGARVDAPPARAVLGWRGTGDLSALRPLPARSRGASTSGRFQRPKCCSIFRTLRQCRSRHLQS